MTDKLIHRRSFLAGSAILGAGAVFSLCPGLVFAQARTEQRLVIVILRGAMDGLAAVVPYGDPAYAALRGDLALSSDSLLRLDDRFALHPSLKPLHDIHREGNLAVIHAAATPYRERSHFDAQNVLELGSAAPHALQSGWLNRLIGAINARDPSLGLAVGESMPMMMRGPAQVGSWAPQTLPSVGEDFMSLLAASYVRDPLFRDALKQGLYIQDNTSDAMEGQDPGYARKQRQAFSIMAKTAGEWLAREGGPRIATLELGGWDTHVQQGKEGGRLANNFELLAGGVADLKAALGPAWKNTVVAMVTEFGRTARPNGNGGTDHGTASAILVAGGRVKGGVYGAWPGLSDGALYQNRDLMPTSDVRGVMKGILNDLYGLPPATLDQEIYPGSFAAKAMTGLVRA